MNSDMVLRVLMMWIILRNAFVFLAVLCAGDLAELMHKSAAQYDDAGYRARRVLFNAIELTILVTVYLRIWR